MATHSSVLAWRIPGTGEPGGLPSLGLHRVGHNWSDLAEAAAAAAAYGRTSLVSYSWSSAFSRSCLLYSAKMNCSKDWGYQGSSVQISITKKCLKFNIFMQGHHWFFLINWIYSGNFWILDKSNLCSFDLFEIRKYVYNYAFIFWLFIIH